MRAAAFLTILTLAACQTPCPAPQTGPVNVSFRCEDGSLLNVTFTRNPDAARVRKKAIPWSISGAGDSLRFKYAGNGAELRGRGNEARWTRPGAAETECDQIEP